MTGATEKLRNIKTLESLVDFLRDDMGWPIETDAEDPFEEIAFEYTPHELGIDDASAAKIESIKRMRPLTTGQPWGVFFVEFEPKKLPVTVLRRILKAVVTKQRATASEAERVTWNLEDLMFISAMGRDDSDRAINFVHFSQGDEGRLPSLKVVAWDSDDTPLHMEDVSEKLTEKLAWPSNTEDTVAWRKAWSSAFTLHHGQVIRTSKKLAVLLADLARDIRKRILATLEVESGTGPITDLLTAFKKALLHDLDEEGFADMYAQTIAYGLLSARIVNPESSASSRINLPVTNPFLRELMEEFLHVGGDSAEQGGAGIDFDELGVNEIVDLLDNTDMEAVLRDFGDNNPAEDPVIHFYEAFLKEYDANLKMQRGVFYTPRPVVSFIVRSVDEILRTEFGLPDGLADTTSWGEMVERFEDLTIPDSAEPDQAFVRILDPATGTGTFLVETIEIIHTTLTKRWAAEGREPAEITEMWNEYVPSELLPRLYGYELLMAPYVIAHLKIGLKLLETGYRFDSGERVRVYLTNALEPEIKSDDRLDFAIPALAHESAAVNSIKQAPAFTVVIGNPPYSVLSANLSDDARSMVDPYRAIEGTPIREKSMLRLEMHLQDDYVKFFRLAQRLVDSCGLGAIGLISNSGYLNAITLRGMRHSLLRTFSEIHIRDLHGSQQQATEATRKAGDKNVFDITQGVAIFIGIRAREMHTARVLRSENLGPRDQKYRELLATSITSGEAEHFTPSPELFLFEAVDRGRSDEFAQGIPLPDLFEDSLTGMVTAHDRLVIGFSDEPLERITEILRNPGMSDEQVRSILSVKDNAGWKLAAARQKLRETPDDDRWYHDIDYRPLDRRRINYHPALVWSDRRRLMKHLLPKTNVAISVSRQLSALPWNHVFLGRNLVESSFVSNRSREICHVLPLYFYDRDATGHWRQSGTNLRLAQLSRIGFSPADDPEIVLHYIYALLHSSIYRERYSGMLQREYPRVFASQDPKLARRLAACGGDLMALHLLEPNYPKASWNVGESRGNPFEQTHVEVLQDGEAKVVKPFHEGDTVWLSDERAFGFSGISKDAWTFRVGSHQVLRQWLKSRAARGGKNPHPGTVLDIVDIRHFVSMGVSIDSTIETMATIDRLIVEYGGWRDAFLIDPPDDTEA